MANATTQFPYSITTLSNGLRVVHIPMAHAASVTIQVYFGAGSRYEEPKISGISHFLEHMAFKGTAKRPTAKEVSLSIEGIGGVLNAWTSEEATAYWSQLPATHFAEGFEVLADMLVNSTFPTTEVTREAQVILEEMAREEDNPDQRVYDVFMELLFPKQALGRRVIGSKETVLAVTRESLLEYIDSLYAPSNAVVAVAGPISKEQTIEVVNKYLSLPQRTIRRSWEPLRAVSTKKPVSLYYKDTEQSHMLLGIPTFAREDERVPIQSVLNTILGHGMSSRLFINVRERKGLAYSIGSANDYFHDIGMWYVYGGIKREKTGQAIGAILDELAKIKTELVDDKELHEAKEKVKGKFVLGLETTQSLANYYGRQVLLKKEVETPEIVLSKIEKITANDIKTLANELYHPESLRLAMVGPSKRGTQFTKLLHE